MDDHTEETGTRGDGHTVPDAGVRHAEEADAGKEHVTGSEPTAAEEEAADRVAEDADEEVARHEHEMQELGADARGEGQLD